MLFRRFFKLSAKTTAGEPSTGLGLSLVKEYVEKLGGKISVKTRWGEGTTFTVQIPKHPPQLGQ
jgi:signal transduction histidine kinase